MTDTLDWLPENDPNNDARAVELHSILRGAQAKGLEKKLTSSMAKGHRAHWRKTLMMKSKLITGTDIGGHVLEVGAGAGWLGSLISKYPDVKKMFILENDPVAIHETMPLVFKALEADESKITRVLGTFHHLPLPDYFDFVIATGALHHSGNLKLVFEQVFSTLKPGGWLIASEPAFPNTMTKDEMNRWRNTSQGQRKDLGGITITHGEIGNYPWRLKDFESAAKTAGFAICPITFSNQPTHTGSDTILSQRKAYGPKRKKIFLSPYFATNKTVYDTLALFCQKPR